MLFAFKKVLAYAMMFEDKEIQGNAPCLVGLKKLFDRRSLVHLAKMLLSLYIASVLDSALLNPLMPLGVEHDWKT